MQPVKFRHVPFAASGSYARRDPENWSRTVALDEAIVPKIIRPAPTIFACARALEGNSVI